MPMLFKVPKPRRFKHPMIYSDVRKERLARIEERARQELGMSSKGTTTSASRRIRFATQWQLRHQQHAKSSHSSTVLLLFLIALFVLLLIILII